MQRATRQETNDRKMPIFGGELGEGEAGSHRLGGTCDGQTPKGPTGTWAHAEVSKEGGLTVIGITEDAGTCQGAQRQATKACGWGVRAMSRWAALCAGR